MHKKLLLNIIIIFSFVIFSLLCSLLLLKSNNVYGGNDTQFHFKRIMELIDSLNHLIILPNFSFNYFHGSSVMLFYPYFNLLPIALLSFFIKSKILLVYGFFIINTFITLNISYFSSKSYTKSYSTSYIFSVIYSTSNIFLLYNFIMNDFGIVASFMLLPLIIFGFLKLIQNRGWIELTIGMSLLSMSHILNLFIVSMFLLLWLIVNIKSLDKYLIFNLFKSIILFLIISSVVYLPLLYFWIFNTLHMPFIQQLETVNLKEFMSGAYGSKNMDTIGFFPIITIFISIFFYKKFNKYVKQMYLLSLLIIIMALFFPWKIITSYKILKILNQMQGTYRILIIPQVLLPLVLSSIITKYINSFYVKITTYYTIIFLSILLQLFVGQNSFIKSSSNDLNLDEYLINNHNKINYSDNPYYKFSNNNQFGKLMNSYQPPDDDYTPKSSLPVFSYVNQNLGFYNDYHQIKVNHIGYNTFNFSSNNNINKLSLPIYAYNKEKIYVYLNNKQVHNYANKNGLLTMDKIQDNIKLNNKVYIKSALNPFKLIGVILSIFGWLFVLGVLIKRKIFKK